MPADEPTAAQTRRLVFGWAIGGIAAIALGYGLLVSGYDLLLGISQDGCSFGTISNKRYQEWLAVARHFRAREGALLDQGTVTIVPGKHYDRASNRRFEQISYGITSIDERIAIVHAMMRADGFRLRAVYPDSLQPFEQLQPLAPAQTSVTYRYRRFGWPGLLFLCVFGCQDRAFATFNISSRDPSPQPASREQPNRFDLSVYFAPEFKGGPWAPPPGTEIFSPACPPVPSPVWSARFLESLQR